MKPKTFWAIVLGVAAILATITGVWSVVRSETDRVEKFDSQYVHFNDYSSINDGFVRFLNNNNGRKVFINTTLDFSPALFEHWNTLNECNNAYPKEGQSEQAFLDAGGSFDILEGKIYKRALQIPHHHRWGGVETDGCSSALEIVIDSERGVAPFSSGGTGVVHFALRGNFIVHRSLVGSTETITLREVDVDEN